MKNKMNGLNGILVLAAISSLAAGCGSSSNRNPEANPGNGNSPQAIKIHSTIPAPLGDEVFGADVVDGKAGSYHLVKIEAFETFSLADDSGKKHQAACQVQVRLSPNANPDHPNAVVDVVSSDLQQIPDGDLNLKFHPPITISRVDGKIAKDLSVALSLYGSNVGQGTHKSADSAYPEHETLDDFLQSASNSSVDGTLHMYRSNEGFEMRTHAHLVSTSSNVIDIEVRTVYQLLAQ